MKILFDYQTFQLQNFGGISRYFVELILWLSTKHRIEIGVKYSDNQYLKEYKNLNIRPFADQRQEFLKGFEFYGKGRIFNLYKRMNPLKYSNIYHINREYSIELLKKQEFDVFHPTYYDDYFLEFIGIKPYVITIHDMIYEKFPEIFPIADNTTMIKHKIAQKASHIIAVSENTKKDITSLWGISEDKISVIYHGADLTKKSVYSCNDIPKDYMLFVGTRFAYKNFLFLIHSIAKILIDKNINLVCTGPPFSTDEITLFRNLEINERVFNRYVNDSEMQFLYKNAIAFIFPSLYEGFGIPILEAFANDCPVILSNTSCFPEIAGDAALYFDPKSRIEIQNKITSIIDSETLRENLILKGRKRLSNFSWVKAASETADVYKKVLK
jgi:glycosyltransferase involved in cell wall biosynthesis